LRLRGTHQAAPLPLAADVADDAADVADAAVIQQHISTGLPDRR